MFFQFLLDVYKFMCNWCKEDTLITNPEYFNYDDIYFSNRKKKEK